MVPEVGLEPTQSCPYGILNPARLPISPLRLHKESTAEIYANDHLKERNYSSDWSFACSISRLSIELP